MQDISIGYAKHVLKNLGHEVPKDWVLEEHWRTFRKDRMIQVGIFRINQEVGWSFDVEPDSLRKKYRTEPLVTYRQIAQYVMCEFGHDQETIGKFYGVDRSTVSHARKKISERMDVDKFFRNSVEEIIVKISNIT